MNDASVTAEMNTATRPRKMKTGTYNPAMIERSNMSHLLVNPESGGTPAIDSDAIIADTVVTGMICIRPPTLSSSVVPVRYSTAPAFRNKSDL